MLQRVREQTQGLGFKIIVGILVVVLAVFGFGGFNLFAPTDPTVATINGTDISRGELELEAQRQLQQIAAQFGEGFDRNLIDPSALQAQALNRLITTELLAQTTDELGLGAADQAISDLLRDNPNFQLDGRFDEATYRRVVGLLGYSPQSFMAQAQQDLTLDRFSSSVTATSVVPRWELAEAARFLAQTRTIGHLDFTVEAFREQVEVSDEDIATYYEENRQDYLTELAVDAEYVRLTIDDLLDDPAVEVSTDEIRGRYEEERAAAAENAELRDSSHILLQINDERDEVAAAAEIAAIREELINGADFAELAKDRSEDPGSKLAGGALGPVGRNIFDPAFEAALFALEAPGDLSEPVKTAFGYHLIRLEGVERQPLPTFEEREAVLMAELKREAAEGLLDERQRELDRLAFENPESLEPIATAFGLEVETVAAVTEFTGEGVFADATARAAVFEPEVFDGVANSEAVALADSSVIVARTRQQYSPEERPLAEVAEQIRELLVTERAEGRVIEAHADALARVRGGEPVQDVASDYELEWQVVENARQSETPELGAALLRAAFLAPAPDATNKSVSEADLPGGGRAVVTVTDIREGDIDALSEAEVANLERVVRDRSQRLDFLSFYRTLEESASISRPQALGS
ncbi:MAG: SurA N-terminal domain-containing protein [Pseudomonadota bacterium]